jgi:quercetin dioxygenase-like cupin family protein
MDAQPYVEPPVVKRPVTRPSVIVALDEVNGGDERSRTMGNLRKAALATAAVAAVAVGANVLPSAAQQPPPPPIATEFLTSRALFTDSVNAKFKIKRPHEGTTVVKTGDASRTLVARFTVQPGASFPWHTHPGPVVVNITEGELVYVPAEDCSRRVYPAGTAFVDPGHGHVHSAVNRGSTPTVFVATFYEAPATGALLIPAATPAGCTI